MKPICFQHSQNKMQLIEAVCIPATINTEVLAGLHLIVLKILSWCFYGGFLKIFLLLLSLTK